MRAQLPLSVGLRDSASFDNFEAGANAAAVQTLRACAEGRGEPVVFVWGATGAGKTHLLQAACRAAGAQGRQAAYVPLRHAQELSVQVLAGLEQLALVCLDDVDAVAGDAGWEAALFDLFNRLREADRALVAAANAAPPALGLRLPDLSSRLAWGPVFQLKPLDDDGKLAALCAHARTRGFELPIDSARYLLQRVPRDMHALFDLLDRMDTASLAAQRRLTVPFVRELLEKRDGEE